MDLEALYQKAKQFHAEVNASVIEHGQLVYSFEILLKKLEDIRVTDDLSGLSGEIFRLQGLAAVLVKSLKDCHLADQDAADSFESQLFEYEKAYLGRTRSKQ